MKDEKALAGHFNELVAFKAAEDSRKLALPQKPEDYALELPADFKPPNGAEFKIDADNPLWSQARSWAQKHGLSKEAFQEGIALVAGDRLGTEQTIKAAREAEVAKLGATGTARIDALTRFFGAQLGETDAKQFMSRVFTASDVQIAEKIVAKMTGAGTFRNNGREPEGQQPGKVSQEAYDKMTGAQRLDYARQFPQAQPNGRAA